MSSLGEKLKQMRAEKHLSQQEVADALHVTRGTYLSYESGRRHPRNRKGYEKLADFFGVDVDYLYGNDEIFLNAASDAYGSRGRKQAAALVAGVQGMFAGGDISEDDKDAVMQAIQAAYWEAKNDAKKYTPKKYR